MRYWVSSILLGSLLAVCAPGIAQEGGGITLSHAFTPKHGHVEQFEQAVKAHRQWVKETGEDWNWSVFQVLTGDDAGTYLSVSGDHTWEDFDAAGELMSKKMAQWQATVGPHVERQRSVVYQLLDRHSRRSEAGMPSTPFIAVLTTHHLKPYTRNLFLDELGKMTDAVKQHDGPPVLWYRSLYGSDNEVVQVEPVGTWAGISKRAEAMQQIGENYSQEQIKAAYKALVGHIESTEKNIIKFRPDLSSQP
jgi:hypothetical protein